MREAVHGGTPCPAALQASGEGAGCADVSREAQAGLGRHVLPVGYSWAVLQVQCLQSLGCSS